MEQTLRVAAYMRLSKADETAQMYGNTADLLQTMGTPVGKLSGAKNLKEFKKILVSGLV